MFGLHSCTLFLAKIMISLLVSTIMLFQLTQVSEASQDITDIRLERIIEEISTGRKYVEMERNALSAITHFANMAILFLSCFLIQPKNRSFMKVEQLRKEDQKRLRIAESEMDEIKDKITKTLYDLSVYLRSQSYVFRIFESVDVTKIGIVGIIFSFASLAVILNNIASGVESGQYQAAFNKLYAN